VFYGAQSYDSIMLIDSAVKATKGNVKDTRALVAAMRKANFSSLRGPFTYNVNHHPIQNFYLLRAEKVQSGDIEMRIQRTVFEKHKDSYYQDCKMPW
jgi:branched-chain amino acid transport system substrate-binding protein